MANTKVKAEQLEAAQTNITSVGTLTALTVDDITIDGSTISDGGDLTLDVGGDITLDADGGEIFLDDGGTRFGHFQKFSNNFNIKSSISDGDLVLQGNDGGSAINALILDMSEAGAATFNGEVLIPEKLTHVGDTDTHFKFAGANDIRIVAGGDEHVAFDGTIVFNQAGTDMDFRVESTSNASMLHVDAGNDRVGIGTNAAEKTLHISSAENQPVRVESTDAYAGIELKDSGSATLPPLVSALSNDIIFYGGHASTRPEIMKLRSAGSVDVKNPGTDKVARFINTGSGTQGITVGTTTADNAGKGIHLSHDNSSTAYVHAYNYAGASFDNLELRGNKVSTVGGTGHNVFRACANGLFSIGSATYTQGRIRQYVYTASLANSSTPIDLFYNTGAYDDLHLLITVEATHSGRTYRTRLGPFGYYQALPTLNAGVGLDFTSATVNTGRRMLQFTNNSGYTAATYISALIFGDNGVTVSNGAISDLL